MKVGGSLIAAIAAFGLLLAPGATAKTFEVTRTADTIPNGCNQGGCTLREAVIAANARDGRDAIVLRSNRLYRIEIPGAGEDAAATGDFDLTGPTVVRTSGGRPATVDANDADRHFDAFATAELRNLELTEGAQNDGGAIRGRGGRISLVRSKIIGAVAAAIYTDGPGGVELSRSVIRGASLNAIRDANDGTIRLHRSRIEGSGAIGILEEGNGGVTVKRSRVTGNGGTGIFTASSGRLTVTRSTIANNSRGLFVDGGAVGVVVDSTIAGNEGDDGGAGIQIRSMAELTLRESTVARNTTSGASGGGILVEAGGTLRIANSTIAGNRAFLSGGGIRIDGPGATASLNAVTIARNVANYDNFSINSGGGGLNSNNGAVFAVRNSLIALNTAPFGAVGPDCYANLGSGGHNLLSDEGLCTGLAGSDMVRANSRIGPLEQNGGPTQTIALKSRSPAIGKAGNDAPNRDQRGRKRDRRPDIGSFERGSLKPR